MGDWHECLTVLRCRTSQNLEDGLVVRRSGYRYSYNVAKLLTHATTRSSDGAENSRWIVHCLNALDCCRDDGGGDPNLYQSVQQPMLAARHCVDGRRRDPRQGCDFVYFGGEVTPLAE